MPLERPSRSKAAQQAAQASAVDVGTQKLVVDLPADLHHRLKLYTVGQRTTIRSYLIELLTKDLEQRGAGR